MSARDGEPEVSKWKARFRSMEAAAIAGLIHAVLLTVAIVLVQTQPSLDASGSALSSFYRDPATRGRLTLALNLTPISVIAFLWFIAVLRRRIGSREDKLFATVFLGGGLLFAALILVGFAVLAAPALVVDATGRVPDLDAIRLVRATGSSILVVLTPRLAAVFILATSTLGMRTGALPQWLTITGQLVAVVMILNFSFADPMPFFFPGWVAVASIALLIRSHEHAIPAELPPGP